MYFYFEEVFRNALNGLNSTPAVMTAIIQIAGAILVATLLFNVYEAFARGGDVRTLGVGAVKYLVLGLVLLNWNQVFLGVNTMFNQVAEFISQNGPGGVDVFSQFIGEVGTEFNRNQSAFSTVWGVVTGSIVGALSLIMLFIAFVIYAVAYAIFCVLYAFYGTILYVSGPLVLALYPALSTTGLARTYLTNLVIFHAWGFIYAILGCLMASIHLGTVQQVLQRRDAAGFFAGLRDAMLLGMVSILLALCIALIPLIARRIVQGDVGSTMFAVVSAVMAAATVGATLAVNGILGAAQGAGGGSATASSGSGGGGGGAGGRGQGGAGAGGTADQSSQQAPRPPEGAPAETGQSGTPAAGSGNGGGASPRPRESRGPSQGPHSFAGARLYTPMSLAAMASLGAGALVGRAAKRVSNALRSSRTDEEREG